MSGLLATRITNKSMPPGGGEDTISVRRRIVHGLPIFRHNPAASLSLAPIWRRQKNQEAADAKARSTDQAPRYRQDVPVPDMPLNRIAQGGSHDRALAAFKADQLRVARRARSVGVAPRTARSLRCRYSKR
jgi:hypothetical protein